MADCGHPLHNTRGPSCPCGQWVAADDWLTATPAERAAQVQQDIPSAPGWTDHERACIAEGTCPVCFGRLGGPGPSPGYAVAAGNCLASSCPAAPCRWAISTPQPHSGIGALMYAPLDVT